MCNFAGNMYKCLTILLLTVLSLSGQAQNPHNLKDVCHRVDEEMEHWPDYLAQRQARIDSLKLVFYQKNDTARVQYGLCAALVDEYCSFQNDSALYYCKMLAEIAPWTKEQSLVEVAKMKMTRQAVKSGMYEAAMNYLAAVDTTTLDTEGMTEYWRVRHFAYVEMSAYCYIWDKRTEYLEEERRCREHLFRLLPNNSAEWLMYKAYDALLADQPKEAEVLSDKCLAAMPRYCMLYRNAAFHRRFICESLRQYDEAAYWQAECAISELRQGMTDQIGLWSLASKIGDKDLERSYRYIRFSWDAISLFGVNVRSWQIAPVLSTIEHQYQAERERLHRIISDGIIVLAILSVLLIAQLFYMYRQRKRLAVANHHLSVFNSRLSDASRSKEEYIVQLLAYNSDFIDQKEEERRKASKMLRNDKIKELTRFLNSADKSNKEMDQLLVRFDEIFLGLYPAFVEDFNALLREEHQIKSSKSGQMNTPLRIFALMRLGIENTADVARILHCSPQTIYNYRNNLRNAYLYDREKFEEAVRSIGMPVLVDK